MKLAFGILVFIWLLCGLIGAWWLDELDGQHIEQIAKGPFTLAQAFNDDPVTYPGPS